MRKTLINLMAITTILAGCSKEASFETGTGSNNGNGGGGGNNGGGQSGSGTYQPTSANSYWHYKETGDITADYTITSTGQKTTINSIDYYTFNSTGSAGNVQSYMGVKNHNYYVLDQGTSPNSGASFDLNFLYLNDTASVGYTWQNAAGQGNGFTAETPGSVVEKGISLTVQGKSYTDVIHTQEELQYDIPGLGLLTFATYDYYVAKGIGIIRVVAAGDPTLAGGFHSTTDLVDYSIK